LSNSEIYLRKDAMERLAPWFDIVEECWVRLASGVRGRIDVLARPKDDRFRNISLAFEMKNVPLFTDGGLSAWVKQSADYVGAVPEIDFPTVASAFVWHFGVPMEPSGSAEWSRVQGILQLAAQFRVGTAYKDERTGGITLEVKPNLIFRSGREGWHEKAEERLLGKRQMAGMRVRAQIGSVPGAGHDGAGRG